MIDFTPLVRRHFMARLYEQLRYKDYADAIQQGVLVKLVEKAALTGMVSASSASYRQNESSTP